MIKLERHFGSSFSDGENLGAHSCCRTGGSGQTDNGREIKDEAVDCDGCWNMGNSGKSLFRTYQY